MKIAIYARVSTDEQKKHGLSIDTQLTNLRDWAKQNGHEIIGEYVDAGVSGKKPYTKRQALSQFIADIEDGLRVDALVFTKLDRFFRSVRHYYQVVGIMEQHHVGWVTIHERYQTLDSQGQFVVNLMLSIAESEATRTSERIKVVFDNKVINGEALGGSIPLGYTVVNKKLVPDENADMIRDLFNYYEKTGSKNAVKQYLYTQYGISRTYKNVERILSRELYTGVYRGNQYFCEPIISREQFERVKAMLAKRSIRNNQSGRIYLFTGLLICPCCGHRLTSAHNGTRGRNYLYYRCPMAYLKHKCPNRKIVPEEDLEKWLLENVRVEYDKFQAEAEKPKRKTVNEAEVKRKLSRLKDLYVDGHITIEEYKADYAKLTATLAQPKKKPTAGKLLAADFQTMYNTVSREDKAAFWHSLISCITIKEDGTKTILFN